MYYPEKTEFVRLAAKGNLVPVYKEIVADLETPVSAYKKIEGDYSFLLESVEGGEKIARYSFLGTCPADKVMTPQSFEEIRQHFKKYKAVKVKGLPRFHGGLVGYISYDMVQEIEPRLKEKSRNQDRQQLPFMDFLMAETLLVFDHIKHKIVIIANAIIEDEPEQAYQEACQKIDQLEQQLKSPLAEAGDFLMSKSSAKKLTFSSNLTKTEFEEMVKKAKAYIKAGEIIQVVLSQRLQAECTAEPFDIYRILRIINPSPYMYYLKYKDVKIIGSSPEVMVRLEDNRATLRPIAGTRPRGEDEEADKRQVENLLASKKEKAEHLMLVDLGRNDLGRVCEYGSVKVTEEMAVEKYSHVMHIVSNITGKLKKGRDAVDLLKATFPAGTVSGAPKVRAMEIIEELENVKRGPYAGSVGYFDYFGGLDTAITIRTIVVKDQTAYIQAGAGIVADSIPAKEYQETLNKAKALLSAVEISL